MRGRGRETKGDEAMAEIRISECVQGEQTIYHWQILDKDGNAVSHSAYHTDRLQCEQEANERLAQFRQEGWID